MVRDSPIIRRRRSGPRPRPGPGLGCGGRFNNHFLLPLLVLVVTWSTFIIPTTHAASFFLQDGDYGTVDPFVMENSDSNVYNASLEAATAVLMTILKEEAGATGQETFRVKDVQQDDAAVDDYYDDDGGTGSTSTYHIRYNEFITMTMVDNTQSSGSTKSITIPDIPVDRASIMMHIYGNGTVYAVNGEFVSAGDLQSDNEINVDCQTAMDQALVALGIVNGTWATSSCDAMAIVMDDQEQPHVTWMRQVSYSSDNGYQSDIVYVAASDGQVVATTPTVMTGGGGDGSGGGVTGGGGSGGGNTGINGGGQGGGGMDDTNTTTGGGGGGGGGGEDGTNGGGGTNVGGGGGGGDNNNGQEGGNEEDDGRMICDAAMAAVTNCDTNVYYVCNKTAFFCGNLVAEAAADGKCQTIQCFSNGTSIFLPNDNQQQTGDGGGGIRGNSSSNDAGGSGSGSSGVGIWASSSLFSSIILAGLALFVV